MDLRRDLRVRPVMSAGHELRIRSWMILVFGLLLPPCTARAASPEVEASLSTGGSLAWLGDARFAATGTRTANGEQATFSATGQQLGIAQPWLVMVGGSLHL